MNPAALYHEIRTLPPDERLRLAHRILHDLVEPPVGSAGEQATTLVEFFAQSPLRGVDLEPYPRDETLRDVGL